jgi:hypothetical protein
MFTPLLNNKHLPGFRLFSGTTLNTIANRVNSLGASVANTFSSVTATVGTTLTAAQILGGIIQRSGPTAAFTDTTDIAANLDAALMSAAVVGTTFELDILNTTAFPMTLSGGTGVTITGNNIIGANSTAVYIVAVVTAPQASSNTPGTYSLTYLFASSQDAFGTNSLVATANNGTTQTLTAAMITGGTLTYHTSTGGTTPSLTLPLGTAMDTALAGIPVGQSYTLRVINSNSGTATIVTNTGWTLTGTLTLATNTWREFVVTRTGVGTYTGVSVGTGTNS